MMLHKRQYRFNVPGQCHRSHGTAIVETVVGLFVLIPVFFLLIDVISLVVGQTINDDLAKGAARAAATAATMSAGESLASGFITNCNYTGPSGLVSQATLLENNFFWNTTSSPPTVSVSTQVVINLPIPVPLGGPKSQTMTAAASEPILGIPAVPPTTTTGS